MIKHPICKAIIKTVATNKLLTFLLVLFVFGSVAFAVIPPLVLEKIVYSLTDEGKITITLALIYFAFIAFGGLIDALRSALITAFGQRTTAKLRCMMAEKLSSLPASYFIHNESGVILSRFTSDVETIDTLFKSGVINIVVDLFKIVFILIAVFTKSLGLGVMLIIATPIIFGVSWHFKSRMKEAQLQNRRAVAKINNHIPETLNNLRTVHSLKKEEYVKKRFRKYVDESYSAFEKTYFYEAIYTPIINEISVIIIAMLMIFASLGGVWQNFFGMHVATAVAVVSYVSKIFSPIENLGMEIQNVQSALAGIKRVEEFFAEEEKQKQTITDFDMLDFNAPAVSFENVDFYYDDNAVLKGVNFSVNGGESVAFVGRTGAGKTTVYRLILGLFSPKSGEVKVFGVPSDKISDGIKRRVFGYVEQGIKLVYGTVYDQVTLGDESIKKAEVENALEIVGLLNTVNSFPNGLYTVASEGLFSQGQMQLLSVARAIVCSPKILLLDEITANLDSETEKLITEAIKKASRDCTVLNISHRLGDIRTDTRILDITKINHK